MFQDLPLFSAFRPQQELLTELRHFCEFGEKTREFEIESADGQTRVPAFVNEFWTAGQRAADNLHEISYRACFKPQLPRFFIERLTKEGDCVYDPFMGRGTTLLEAALLGRCPWGNDINPLSGMLVLPRLLPPTLQQINDRLARIDWDSTEQPCRKDLLVFYHPKTLGQIEALRCYLSEVDSKDQLDSTDRWIRMIALNRLTGHSGGFFSVYTLPPNQAVSLKSQIKINEQRKQVPPERDVPKLIAKKSRNLLKDLRVETWNTLNRVSTQARIGSVPADRTANFPSAAVDLIVTSPPFLNVVDYAGDNWLRCWFAGIDPAKVEITAPSSLMRWRAKMTDVFAELKRLLKPAGHVAFEVGEVKNGKVRLEETVICCGRDAGLTPILVLINQQEFTKTANCWGVNNNTRGTNSNRIVLFRK